MQALPLVRSNFARRSNNITEESLNRKALKTRFATSNYDKATRKLFRDVTSLGDIIELLGSNKAASERLEPEAASRLLYAAATQARRMKLVGTDLLRIARDPRTAELVSSITDEAPSSSGRLDFASYSRALWSLGALGGEYAYHREVEALIMRFKASDFALPLDAQGLVEIVWSLASSRHYSSQLPEIEKALLRSGGMDRLKERGACTLLWGLATLGHCPSDLLLRGWRRFVKAMSDGKPSELAALSWSLSVFVAVHQRRMGRDEADPSDLALGRIAGMLREVLQEAARRDPGTYKSRERRQLFQAVITLYALNRQLAAVAAAQAPAPAAEAAARGAGVATASGSGRGPRPLARLDLADVARACDLTSPESVEMLSLGLASWQDMWGRRGSRNGSAFQREVRDSLQRIGVRFKEEGILLGCLSVDCILHDRATIIEADGPTHFSREIPPGPAAAAASPAPPTGPRTPLHEMGHTQLKRWQLEALGWSVINVRLSDWEELRGAAARGSYLEAELEACGTGCRIRDADSAPDLP